MDWSEKCGFELATRSRHVAICLWQWYYFYSVFYMVILLLFWLLFWFLFWEICVHPLRCYYEDFKRVTEQEYFKSQDISSGMHTRCYQCVDSISWWIPFWVQIFTAFYLFLTTVISLNLFNSEHSLVKNVMMLVSVVPTVFQ